jgi:dTDP-4-dehydrorhamnose 3,5-epimerase
VTAPAGAIDGVAVRPLRRIPDERGAILHMLRADDPHFEQFGEIYFSMVYPGVVKGWHRHRRMTLNYAVPVGMIKLALYDDRPGSRTRGGLLELFVGEQNYALVTIPPGVWNGFKGLGSTAAIVANCASHPHDPEEIERADPLDGGIPYRWDVRHG